MAYLTEGLDKYQNYKLCMHITEDKITYVLQETKNRGWDS